MRMDILLSQLLLKAWVPIAKLIVKRFWTRGEFTKFTTEEEGLELANARLRIG